MCTALELLVGHKSGMVEEVKALQDNREKMSAEVEALRHTKTELVGELEGERTLCTALKAEVASFGGSKPPELTNPSQELNPKEAEHGDGQAVEDRRGAEEEEDPQEALCGALKAQVAALILSGTEERSAANQIGADGNVASTHSYCLFLCVLICVSINDALSVSSTLCRFMTFFYRAVSLSFYFSVCSGTLCRMLI